MQINKEEGIELLVNSSVQAKLDFIKRYCEYHNKDKNMIALFLQLIYMHNMLSELVKQTVHNLLEKQGIHLIYVFNLKTNQLLKII